MPKPGPYEEKLDALLAANDSGALIRAVVLDVKDADTVQRGLNWLSANFIVTGGSSYTAYLYSALSWRISESVPEPSKTEFKRAAVARMMLARWLILSEGFQCADQSAPGSRLALMSTNLKPIVEYGAQLSTVDGAALLREMFPAFEISFPLRDNDVWLCNGGAKYFVKYFEKHPNAQGTDITVPGATGKTVDLPADPSILPEFVPYASWKEKRRDFIDRLAKQLGVTPPKFYFDDRYKMK